MNIVIFFQTAFDAFLQSYFFAALKIFFAVYSIVLIINIVFILFFRNVGSMLKQGSYGTTFVPSLAQSTMKKQWAKIENRLQSGNASEYKVAILEADNIVEGILSDIGYDSGSDMAQKIEQLRVMQPDDAVTIDEAHHVRNRIVFERDFHPDFEQTKKVLNTYKDFLKKFDYFQ